MEQTHPGGGSMRVRRAAIALAFVLSVPAVAQGKSLWKGIGDFFAQVKRAARVAAIAVKMLKEYPQRRDALRAQRAKPPPLDTGYRPDYYRSAAGLAELERKAAVYSETAKRFVRGGLVVNRAYIDPSTKQVKAYVDGLGDAGIYSGPYLAAVAYEYGTTGSPHALEHMKELLAGHYNLMTLASAPDGTILHRPSGQRMSPRPGLPVRGFGNIADPLLKDMEDLKDPEYIYTGALLGLPRAVYHVNSDISRDQVTGLFLGLGAAWEVLRKRNAEPEWQARIARIVGATMKDFVRNGYRFIDFNGKTTKYGDQSNMGEPTVLLANLSWLGLAVTITGDAELRAHYNRIADRYFGKKRGLKSALWTELSRIVEPLTRQHIELLGYTITEFNYALMAYWLEMNARYTPDDKLRAVFADFQQNVLWPLLRPLRTPLFDFYQMRITGVRDPKILERTFGVLGQYRREPYPFGNPVDPKTYFTDFRGRAELRDGLFDWLRAQWETKLKPLFPEYKGDNPFFSGGGIWPLGPGLVCMGDITSYPIPYYLRSIPPQRWWVGEWNPENPLVQQQPQDYLHAYWYGRYHGFIAPGATIQVGGSQAQARTVLGRVLQRLGERVTKLLESLKSFISDAAMRLVPTDRKIAKHVVPLAHKMAADTLATVTAQAAAFWSELGPSLRELDVQTRHSLVDGPWNELRTAIQKHIAAVRKSGVDRVSGWFGERHRAKGVLAFTQAFDATAAPLAGRLDAMYGQAMGGIR
jgi:hypothetical protein